MKEMTKANLDAVLLDFRVEAGLPRPTILEAYSRQYPQFARELTDYALEWLLNEAMTDAEPAEELPSNASSPIVSRAISRLYDRIRERDVTNGMVTNSSGSQARNLFQALPVSRKRELCARLGIDMPLFAKFQNRLIEADSVPFSFLERFAQVLEDTVDGLLSYLRLPAMANVAANFKAEGKPKIALQKVSFEDAVRASSLDEKQKQRLLKS